MPIGRSIIKYGYTSPHFGHEPIFFVRHLTQRAFDNGFRTLNPEVRASSYRFDLEEEKLSKCLDEIEGLDIEPHTDWMRPIPQDPIPKQLPPSRKLRTVFPGKSPKEWSIIAQTTGQDR